MSLQRDRWRNAIWIDAKGTIEVLGMNLPAAPEEKQGKAMRGRVERRAPVFSASEDSAQIAIDERPSRSSEL